MLRPDPDAAPGGGSPRDVTPRKWILVVDDDPAVRKLLVKVLEEAGYAVVAAEDGAAACDLVQHLLPHLIILDLHMPRMSGVEFLARWQQIPVLILSGYLAEHRLDPHRSNVVGMLEKPVDLSVLIAKVREVLGN